MSSYCEPKTSCNRLAWMGIFIYIGTLPNTDFLRGVVGTGGVVAGRHQNPGRIFAVVDIRTKTSDRYRGS